MTANEFIDLIDELCFEHGFEIYPVTAEFGSDKLALRVEDSETSETVLYIDGDGRGK